MHIHESTALKGVSKRMLRQEAELGSTLLVPWSPSYFAARCGGSYQHSEGLHSTTKDAALRGSYPRPERTGLYARTG
jgi:hypothetical protein